MRGEGSLPSEMGKMIVEPSQRVGGVARPRWGNCIGSERIGGQRKRTWRHSSGVGKQVHLFPHF